jgi:hypothetical protein
MLKLHAAEVFPADQEVDMRKTLWEFIPPAAMITMMLSLVAPPAWAVVDGSSVAVGVEALTITDVEYEQDVLFEVTISNRSDTETWVDLWFTADLFGIPNEKPVTSPYIDYDAPFGGLIPPNDAVVLQLRARPLDNVPVGPYAFNVKAGVYSSGLVKGSDVFRGLVLDGDLHQRAPGAGGDSWVISSVWAKNEAASRFLARNSRSSRTVNMIQNYPNPFNPETSLTYEVKPNHSGTAPVQLDIYNIHGHRIRTLVDGAKPAGIYTVKWDGRDSRGVPVQSGVYIFKLQSERDVSTRKGILTK